MLRGTFMDDTVACGRLRRGSYVLEFAHDAVFDDEGSDDCCGLPRTLAKNMSYSACIRRRRALRKGTSMGGSIMSCWRIDSMADRSSLVAFCLGSIGSEV